MGRGGRAENETHNGDQRLTGILTEFLEQHFAAASYASEALTDTTVTAQVLMRFIVLKSHVLPSWTNENANTSVYTLQAKIESLESSIRFLDERLSSEVSGRQEELLNQANSLRDAEGAVQVEILIFILFC